MTIYWRPVVKERQPLHDRLGESLSRAFGPMPFTLTTLSVPILKGMVAVHGGLDNPYRLLLDAVEKHGTVVIEDE